MKVSFRKVAGNCKTIFNRKLLTLWSSHAALSRRLFGSCLLLVPNFSSLNNVVTNLSNSQVIHLTLLSGCQHILSNHIWSCDSRSCVHSY